MKKYYIAGFTIFHAMLTLAATFLVLGEALQRFDNGTVAVGKSLWEHLFNILSFPLFSSDLLPFPGLLGYIPLFLNSFLWAFVSVNLIYFLSDKIFRIRKASL